MKAIIFSVLVMFLSLSNAQAQKLAEFKCSLQGENNNYAIATSTNVSCAKDAPAFVIHELFKKSFPDHIYFERKEYSNDEFVSSNLGVSIKSAASQKDLKYALYVTKTKKGAIEFMQGTPSSDCHYKYTIKTVGKYRYCTAQAPKNNSLACVELRANDPIGDHVANQKSRTCDVFLEAMLGCQDEKKDCKKSFYRFMNAKDDSSSQSKPRANPNAIPPLESGTNR